MKNKIIKLGAILVSSLLLTGCFEDETMKNIKIKTSVYPIEYITSYLYEDNAELIGSIYPDGINVSKYTLTDKQINDFSNNNLFIYNGTSNEPDYAIRLLNTNKQIKIIDAARGMEYENGVEELWLDPFNFLMLAENIKNGLSDYIKDPYLVEEIQEKYDELNLEASELDVKIKEAAEHAENNTVLVSSDVFKFLEKYGINVISLEENENLTEKTINDAISLIKDGTIEYIFIKSDEEQNDTIKKIVSKTGVTVVPLHSLSVLTEKERQENATYVSIMEENIEKIRKELYKDSTTDK